MKAGLPAMVYMPCYDTHDWSSLDTFSRGGGGGVKARAAPMCCLPLLLVRIYGASLNIRLPLNTLLLIASCPEQHRGWVGFCGVARVRYVGRGLVD